jgi:transposase-like protein
MRAIQHINMEQRMNAVLGSLAAAKDYQRIAGRHDVSYQQLYNWVQRYESGGIPAPTDRCGRKLRSERLISTQHTP